MTKTLLPLPGLLVLLCAADLAGAGEVRFPGTDVSIVAPAGFSVSGTGATDRDRSVLVTANVLEGGIASFRLGLTDERLSAKGMRVRSREEATVDGRRDGILLLLSQRVRETDLLKWMLVFGDEDECVLVVATFAAAEERKWKSKLRRAVLSAKRRGDVAEPPVRPDAEAAPTRNAAFRLEPVEPLVFAKAVKGEHFYARGAVHPPRDAADPVLSVSRIAGAAAVDNRPRRAKALLAAWAGLTDVKVEDQRTLVIGGLPAVEIVGRAKDAKTGVPLRILLVAIFPDDGVWLIRARGLLQRDPPFLPGLYEDGAILQAAITLKR